MSASVNSTSLQCGIRITLFSPTVAFTFASVWTQRFSNLGKIKIVALQCLGLVLGLIVGLVVGLVLGLVLAVVLSRVP